MANPLSSLRRVGAAVIVSASLLGIASCSSTSREASAPQSLMSTLSPSVASPSVESPEQPQAPTPVEGLLATATAETAASQSVVSGGFSDEVNRVRGSIVAFAYPVPIVGSLRADGRPLTIRDNEALNVILSCAWGCSSDWRTFSLPDAKPLSQVPGASPGPLLWTIYTDGWFLQQDNTPLGEYIEPAFAGEVVFTAVQAPWLDELMRNGGFQKAEIGALVAPGVRAYVAPSSFPQPTDNTMTLGRLRLFAPDATLPPGVIEANGRRINLETQLGRTLRAMGYQVTNGQLAVPDIPAMAGYRWAIDARGYYPNLD